MTLAASTRLGPDEIVSPRVALVTKWTAALNR